MNLKYYLGKIKEGKPINFTRFISLLPSAYSKQKRELFDATLQSPQKWLISCSPEVLDKLEQLAKKPINRLEATVMGDSHRVSVSSGFLLVYHQGLNDNRPDVVYLEQENYLQGFEPKKRLLIVENEENFFLPTLMLKLAGLFTKQTIDLSNTDIVLGSGLRATSKLALVWYRQYSHILCAFDYDLAGLKMYKTLKTHIDDRVNFLQPQDYKQYGAYFKMKPKSHQQLIDFIVMAEQLGFLELSETVKKQRKFMEQEMLLMEMDDE
ncbi:MAG: hypothetical protein GQ547_09185 [Methylophaga sp.]|nr:hypothetical protein [Methylophaga sp.]